MSKPWGASGAVPVYTQSPHCHNSNVPGHMMHITWYLCAATLELHLAWKQSGYESVASVWIVSAAQRIA